MAQAVSLGDLCNLAEAKAHTILTGTAPRPRPNHGLKLAFR